MAQRSGRHRDLYQVLGVAREADADALRKAYRKLARQYHPDVNPDDPEAEERFKEISHAYAVLSDADQRRNYDEFGAISLEAGFDAEAARRARDAFGARFGGFRPGGDSGGFEAEYSFGDLDDLLGGVFSQFSGPRRSRGPRRGADLASAITLDFLDAARGGEQRISVGRPGPDGRLQEERLTVRIPPGVADGGRIRLAGKGAEDPSGGPPGDLLLAVHVRPHPVFRREGRDLHLDLPISIREAVLGARVEIPTLEGRATVTVPPGTDSGRRLRLRGKGIAGPGGEAPGDLLATVEIRVPRGVDEKTARQLEELARFDPPDLRKELFR